MVSKQPTHWVVLFVSNRTLHKVSNVLKSFQSSRKFDREWRGKARIFNFPLTALKNKNVRRAFSVCSSRFFKARRNSFKVDKINIQKISPIHTYIHNISKCSMQKLQQISLTLFQLGRDKFYHRDSISRDDMPSWNRVKQHHEAFYSFIFNLPKVTLRTWM